MTVTRETERAWPSDNARDPKAKLPMSLKIASYNVRTLNGAGKLEQINKGCSSFNINIMAIQEHRQIFKEQEIKFEWTQNKQHLFVLASASQEGQGGVGFILDQNSASSLKDVKKVTSRIIVAYFYGNPQLTIVAVYAPTDCADDREKDSFYDKLRDTLNNIPPHNVVITLGDFNARIGSDSHQTSPHIIGKYVFHTDTNDNGQRMIDICENFNLRPAFSRFPHRKGRLWTWEHPSGARAQLDHILIRGKWLNSLHNCRAFDTIEIDSDHRVVCANFKLSLRTSSQPKVKRIKYNWDLLRSEEVEETYKLKLSNHFTELYNIQNAVDKTTHVQLKYDALVKATEKTCEEVLGTKRKSNLPDWVSPETLHLEIKRDKAKRKFRDARSITARTKWRDLVAKVNESYQKDEAAQLQNQLNELESAAKSNKVARTWEIVNKICGRKERKINKIKMRDGSMPNSEKELLDEWAGYFNDLLNGSSTISSNLPQPAPSDLDIKTGPIDLWEVEEAIKGLKDNKAPGNDSTITVQILKRGGKLIKQKVFEICSEVYNEHHAPKQWTTNIIVPVPKKGNLQQMTNYRGISLMSIAAKVYNRFYSIGYHMKLTSFCNATKPDSEKAVVACTRSTSFEESWKAHQQDKFQYI